SETISVGEAVGFPRTITSPTGTDCLWSFQSPFSMLTMDSDYDVAIIGGAFSGAATALMLKRKRPQARILIIEKTDEFDRKVGESTTEVSSCYMTRILGLTHYLGHHQLAKQGLRLWFSNRPDQGLDRKSTRLNSSHQII